MYIRYQDQYRSAGDGMWRIGSRHVLVDWTETHPVDQPVDRSRSGGDRRPRRAPGPGGGRRLGIGLASARLLGKDGAQVTIAGRTVASSRMPPPGWWPKGWTSSLRCVTRCRARIGTLAAVQRASKDGLRGHRRGGSRRGIRSTRCCCSADDEFSREVDLNVRPVFLTLKYAGQAMVRNGAGSFVAISSNGVYLFGPIPRLRTLRLAGKAAVDQLHAGGGGRARSDSAFGSTPSGPD